MGEDKEQFVTLRGDRVLLRRGGAGEPVLYLHGAGGLPGWLPFLDRLADRYEVLAPDHPSFGRSPTPPWLDHLTDLAYFYLDFLEELAPSGAHVIGHSMGGWLAMEIAIRSTEHLRSLTLIGAAGIRVEGKPPADIFVMNREETARARFADPEFVARELADNPTPEQQDETVVNDVAAARLTWQPRLFNPQLRKWLHRIDVPTHIVWGDRDAIIPPAYAGALAELIPGAKVTVIEKSGHNPQIERLEPTLRAVTAFLGA
jgi:pimeloyl-ACP methyl ester carboxylesterase